MSFADAILILLVAGWLALPGSSAWRCARPDLGQRHSCGCALALMGERIDDPADPATPLRPRTP